MLLQQSLVWCGPHKGTDVHVEVPLGVGVRAAPGLTGTKWATDQKRPMQVSIKPQGLQRWYCFSCPGERPEDAALALWCGLSDESD
uniref:Uncharacterized protein n=1 Tax=viral metagenome TaxID=1070528 RepID=A0A6H1Z9J9_9ZZZZ